MKMGKEEQVRVRNTLLYQTKTHNFVYCFPSGYCLNVLNALCWRLLILPKALPKANTDA